MLSSHKQENEFEGSYLVIWYTLLDCDIKINTYVLIDSGYTGLFFMNEAFTYQYNFPYY
jgi:hypothetical protein